MNFQNNTTVRYNNHASNSRNYGNLIQIPITGSQVIQQVSRKRKADVFLSTTPLNEYHFSEDGHNDQKRRRVGHANNITHMTQTQMTRKPSPNSNDNEKDFNVTSK